VLTSLCLMAFSGNPCCTMADYIPALAALLPQVALIDDVSCVSLRSRSTPGTSPDLFPPAQHDQQPASFLHTAPATASTTSESSAAAPPTISESTIASALLQASCF
jgi:hypothetical protein